MIKVSLSWIAAQVEGQLLGADQSIEVVSTDTRNLPPASLFVALKGDRYDAHAFLADAIASGAAALMVQQSLSAEQAGAISQIVVADTRYALGQLAHAVRKEVNPTVIAITGSSGKTTVKEMLAKILNSQGQVLATAGNFNNDIGVPLTLLRLTQADRYAVVELGANHLGEIAYTTRLTEPDVAIINNVAPAHVEGFGSIHGVFRAKSEIFRALAADGLALTPQNSEFAECWQQQLNSRNHLSFGQLQNGYAQADCYADDITIDSRGCAEFTLHLAARFAAEPTRVKLNLPGLHNVDNAVVALTAAVAVGCPLQQAVTALAQLEPVAGRLNVVQVSEHLQLIDDTYNANVGSVKAALDMLGAYPGYTIMALGDMGELGAQARQYHEEIGAYAIKVGINNLFTLGVLSQSASEVFNGRGGRHFSDFEGLIGAIIATVQQAPAPVTILAKGSRSAHMERVIQALEVRQAELQPRIDSEGQHAC
ncbi:UDP-N-acetylmuramoyl-tripeptide--D-alanyl-D-alanine ligase [Pseudidiomarina taiwanensis]|uniref:UDP-N-acetylmuramoyl-tripeptide--D-alanyl-D-alanine ligase n=1 Tax=Pseudidiomarina taiwanensis TaxID=337250 RepID=A0A432ZKU3_9GAMM|nr:UDP-N-acetylmuramoyl-tripeptide--D-alanyl-D-alanine ligase [Pseudidiomarina taiwanensis]RUO78533.1 UDP-N-acetylmuramoyl-tripeptide--D-alanyl-D-alanine ligase [Pseudidiomarina taiwanensis]